MLFWGPNIPGLKPPPEIRRFSLEYIVMTDETQNNTVTSEVFNHSHPRGWRYGILKGDPTHFLQSLRSSSSYKNSIGMKPVGFEVKAIAFDVDTTFIQGETLDEIATSWGCGQKVEEITKLAMNGQYGFSKAISQRVALLKGMPLAQATNIANQIPIQPHATELCRWAKSCNIRLFLISGGFTLNVRMLAEANQMDAYAANEFEIKDGHLTGKLANKNIVDARFKASWLEKMCRHHQVNPRSLVGVGDGANDRFMMDLAGLAVGFYPKNALLPHLHVINRSGSYRFLQDFLELAV